MVCLNIPQDPSRVLCGRHYSQSYVESYDTCEMMLSSFLMGRTQKVSVNGSLSSSKPVLSGIPQGSVLGPLLFVIYINDLPDKLCSSSLMFADDTKVFREICSENDLECLQRDLACLEKWSDTWLLKFHPEKCKILTVGKLENI